MSSILSCVSCSTRKCALLFHKEMPHFCKSITMRPNCFVNIRISSFCKLPVKPNHGVRWYRSSKPNYTRSSGKSSQGNHSLTPFEGIQVESGPVHVSSLLKPLGFALAFSSCSFAGAAIWQYENMRMKALSLMKQPVGWIQERYYTYSSAKVGSWRQEVNNWWNGLTEGQRLFYPICFANCLVFVAWRIPAFQSIMVRYFCSNPASKVLCWPMVLSTFSHFSFLHLMANMYVLHSFSSGAVASLGKEQFLGLYLSAGALSSLASYFHKVVVSQSGLSLGASGAIMAVLGYVCTQYPDTRLSIIFLPFFTFTAGVAIKVIMALDAAGVLLRWKLFDHAAHLGGALFGIGWAYWGNQYIWQNREPILHAWHKLRGPPS